MAKKKDEQEKIKRQKDLATIKDLFSLFPRPVVDGVLEEAEADRILTDHILCLNGVEGIFRSTLFHLYDEDLRKLLDDLFTHWDAAWYVGRTTHHDYLHRGTATLMLTDFDPSERWGEHVAYLDHIAKARHAMEALTRHLHEHYPDFDLPESDKEACRKWGEAVREAERRVAEIWDRYETDPADTPSDENAEGSDEPVPLLGETGGMRMSNDATNAYLINVGKLKGILNDRARGGSPSEAEYAAVRSELLAVPVIRDALPTFVLTCHTVQEFWHFIQPKFATYRERTEFLQREFGGLLSELEQGRVPSSGAVSVASSSVVTPPPRPDLVIVTVNEHETQAVHDAFLAATGSESVAVPLGARLYFDLGTVNGTRVYHAISEMGSGGSGGMQQTVEKAISALDPGAVIAVGIAFGVNEKEQAIGDILVSKLLRLYDLQRVGKRSKITLRGARPDASPRLMSHFRGFSQTKWKGAKVRVGVMLTGDKLVDNVDYRDQLIKFEGEGESVGGEMEGAGLYVSSYDNKIDWIVIKAICDWADGNKGVDKTARQQLAAKNAAEFVVKSLQNANLRHPNAGNQHRP
ncbi:MAG: hypothetical protein K8T89_19890 [Planctomycetes bacterium]|nr:hypothetical protein [Planctomycetota bacterium]